MKKGWFVVAGGLLIASQLCADDFFSEILEEQTPFITEESPELFGMELDDGEELLFPWNGEEAFSSFVEEKARAVLKEVDELLTFDLPEKVLEMPSHEAVPERASKTLSTPPRVVPAKPAEMAPTVKASPGYKEQIKPNNISPSSPAKRRVLKQKRPVSSQNSASSSIGRPTAKKREIIKSSYQRPTKKSS